MFRDGWLSGMDAGLDIVMARMDGETGLYNRAHFESLVDRAIGDSLCGRERRAGDGPVEGNVAVLAVRVINWAQLSGVMTHAEETKVVTRVGEAMKGAFRVDDVIGRIADDTFGLLLRGCPIEMHDTISARCRADLAEMRLQTPEGWLGIDAAFVTVAYAGEGIGQALVAQTVTELS
jgi:GGDEF domain-containing protein